MAYVEIKGKKKASEPEMGALLITVHEDSTADDPKWTVNCLDPDGKSIDEEDFDSPSDLLKYIEESITGDDESEVGA